MRSRGVLLVGVLSLGLVWGACRDNGDGNPPVDSGVPVDPRSDGGELTPDAGPPDSGTPTASDFRCNVARQEGCDAGQSCLFTDLVDGGTGSRCFAGACDVVRQDCASSERCTYATRTDGTTQRACVARGTAGEGAPCTLARSDGGPSFDTCASGLLCEDERLGDGGTGFFCRRLCHGTPDCGDAGSCNTVTRLPGTSELPLLCGPPSSSCDPFGQDCTSPLGCYPSTSGPVCVGIGTRGEGESCDFSNQCARGSTCVRTGSELTCRKLCRHPSGDPACASGTCRPLDDNPGVGACVVP